MCSLLRQREDGQALVLVTLVLTFLIMLILTCIEVGGRYLELAEIEDALKQATRSSVQTFDYATFARGGQLLRETGAAKVSGCAGIVPNSARFAACSVFLSNLRDMRGLAETNEQTAAPAVLISRAGVTGSNQCRTRSRGDCIPASRANRIG